MAYEAYSVIHCFTLWRLNRAMALSWKNMSDITADIALLYC